MLFRTTVPNPQHVLTTLAVMAGLALSVSATAANEHEEAAKTEVWEPEPTQITFNAEGVPSDAKVLLGPDSDLYAWRGEKGDKAAWDFDQGVMTVSPGAGAVVTEDAFCDMQLHIEWRSPDKIEGRTGQQLGNSGVFLQQRYEVQVLDSWENRTYSNGQAASVYKQHIPLVNAMKPTGEWQRYDILFTAPRFDAEGALKEKARLTVLHNGVVVQNHVEIQGTTEYIGAPKYQAHGCAPLMLQDHGDKVSFRNIWVREL